MLFLSRPSQGEDKYLSEDFLAGTDSDYDNTTDVIEAADNVSYEDIEEDDDVYPDGTVVKFKCTQTRGGKFASWQIR